MINPQLYYSLVRQFGRVTIQHEGYEADKQLTFENGKYGLEYKHGEYYVLNCPFCNDTKKRLYISYLWGVPEPERPWNARLNLALCFNDNCLKHRENRNYLAMVLLQLLPDQRPNPVVLLPGIVFSEQSREFEYPGDCLPLNHPSLQQHAAIGYLQRRGYDIETLASAFHVQVCTNAAPKFPLMQNRINAPVFFKDKQAGWQGRYPEDLNWKECGFPKYYNWPGMAKSEILYNHDGAQRYRVIVLYEGVTKVWRLGLNGVAVLGSNVSPRQTAILAEMLGSDGALVLALDPDTRRPDKWGVIRENVVFDRLCAHLPGRVTRIQPNCDPGDLRPDVSAELITQALRRIGCSYEWNARKPIDYALPPTRRILRL